MSPEMLPCFFLGSPGRAHHAVTSGPGGRATVSEGQLFAAKFTGAAVAPLWVFDPERRLAAYETVDRDTLGATGVREVRLQRACRVVVELGSLGLETGGKHVRDALCEIWRPGENVLCTLEGQFTGNRIELLLPPGEYCVAIRSSHCENTCRFLRITPGQEGLEL